MSWSKRRVLSGGCLLYAVLLAGLAPAPVAAKGPSAPGARVVSTMVGDAQALPLACFRPGAGWRSGDACLPWLPREGTLRSLDGGGGRLLGQDARVRCSGYAPARRGLRVEAPIQSGAVLWTEDSTVRFEWPQDAAEPAPLPREVLAELYRTAGRHLGAEPGVLGVTGASSWPLDVDGDGTQDALVLAEALARDAQAAVAAIVLSGPEPRTVPLGVTPGVGGLSLRGVMDLDADGVPELWVVEDTGAALIDRLVRMRGTRLEELARYVCPMASPEELAGPEEPHDPEANACRSMHRDTLEPNDSPARATRPRLTGEPMAEAQYEGLGLHAGDTDWFRLTVPAYGSVSALVTAASLNARLVLGLYAEDGVTRLAGSAPDEGAVGWAHTGAAPRAVLLKVSRKGKGCAAYSVALSSGGDPRMALKAEALRLPLPTAEQRGASPHPDREAELLALTLSRGFVADRAEVSRISRDLAAIRVAELSLRDVHYLAPHDGQHLTVFFENPTAAEQGVYFAWDALNAAFGLKGMKPGETGGLELEFAPVLHLPRVAALYQGLPGITEVGTPGVIDGSTVHVCRKGEAAWYTFDIGSGDCPSGCLQRTWHVFRVARPGAGPERLGTAVPGAKPEPEWLRQLQRACPRSP